MRGYIRVILITLTVITTLISLIFTAISIAMIVDQSGHEMGNEAFGYFSTAAFFALLFGISATVLWVYLSKRKKRDSLLAGKSNTTAASDKKV